MLVTGIKSKPVYAPLRADARGRYHLMLGFGQGAVALVRVLGEMQSLAPEGLARTRVLLMSADGETPADGAMHPSDVRRSIESLPLQEVRTFADMPALLGELKPLLADSLMGTRLYVAGPESFIGLALKIALEFNLNKDEIRAEQLGSLARRVYCIHCRATAESVRTNIVRCPGCERWLLVRDHYSRRLAAYMGVMVDAEASGELPPIKEVFV